MTIRLRSGILAAFSALALAACAGGGYPSQAYLSPADMEQQRNMEGAVAGCLIGGILGALVNDDSAMQAAAIGCAAGGATGYVASEYINDQNAQYADAQYAAYDMEQAATNTAEYYRQSTEVVYVLIEDERRRIDYLNAQYQRNQITADQYRNQMAAAEDNIAFVYGQLDDIENALAQMDADLARNGGTALMYQRRNELLAERDNLQRAVEELQRLYSRGIPAEVRTGA